MALEVAITPWEEAEDVSGGIVSGIRFCSRSTWKRTERKRILEQLESAFEEISREPHGLRSMSRAVRRFLRQPFDTGRVMHHSIVVTSSSSLKRRRRKKRGGFLDCGEEEAKKRKIQKE